MANTLTYVQNRGTEMIPDQVKGGSVKDSVSSQPLFQREMALLKSWSSAHFHPSRGQFETAAKYNVGMLHLNYLVIEILFFKITF